ncbi:MAG: hypothetical protein OSJ58_10245 [Dysosmobacter sp.]|nr:hypothetical protein [Dysosmobacter sp.]
MRRLTRNAFAICGAGGGMDQRCFPLALVLWQTKLRGLSAAAYLLGYPMFRQPL